ncbi:MAG: aminoglycoside phosphotransferase [SAR86 cluster bacterium]|uniref:Aminoglycoside phosphotransferase n=1 Tax=SAR86 cluster bacterium TaxID=2030880 RepID=A0A2A5AVH0_9GAMM|nr:MAG: aminoglycoside phosphotransferase [SAR86 cluster bacterium]
MSDAREQDLTIWANQALDQLVPEKPDFCQLEVVSGDASFRRYFRARVLDQSFIVVDAPPATEDSRTFVKVSNLFRDAGVLTPNIFDTDFDNGFMLLEDFGDNLFLPLLLEAQTNNGEAEANRLYHKAMESLVKFQKGVDGNRLPHFDRAKLRQEMELFEHWFCEVFLELDLSEHDRKLIATTFSFLEDELLAQKQVAVHRDYHSRNLLLLNADTFGADSGPGIIDFQDAVLGAYTYDLVSLLRDCYIRWSPDQVKSWALEYLPMAQQEAIIEAIPSSQFLRDMDMAGLQRHLKVMGIFSRLCIRDKKPQYLADIPLVIRYFLEVASSHEEMAPFVYWLENTVLTVAKTKLKLDL